MPGEVYHGRAARKFKRLNITKNRTLKANKTIQKLNLNQSEIYLTTDKIYLTTDKSELFVRARCYKKELQIEFIN